MSNWDLMMPGMGLTAIGLAGVTISYAGIAHTFIDGMHALTGLTMFIGLIFLAAGILEGGVSTSNRAKATTLVVLGISLSFGLAALNFNAISTIPTFAGVMLIVVVPAIIMAYVAMKMPQYAKPVSIIFIIAVGAAIAAYVGFGLFGPSPYLVPPPAPVEEEAKEPAPTAPIFAISILKGSATQGNPDYDPDAAQVPRGNIIEWTNHDDVSHTVTSAADGGATFDSSLISAGATYRLDTSTLQDGTYDYFCIVHPWMTASFTLVEGGAAKAPVFDISILADSQIQGNPDYDPDAAQVPLGSAITWTNHDTAAHTVTSAADAGATFDSGLISAGATYQLDTSKLGVGKYEYFCIVHPWMQASFEVVEKSGERLTEGATAKDPNSLPVETPEHAGAISTETVEEVTTPPEEPVEQTVEPPTEPEIQAPQPTPTNMISIPQGASVPGCETTNECFVPSIVSVPVGTTVTWTNDDTAAHTVTSGANVTPDGIFDSGLFMAGKSFSHTFDTPGQYPYYCLVHPWMSGTVTVE
ncbi:MAG TPA: plastocyanin/azurin family copper-binding protein [Candidatus Nitrosotenuis sp.]|nr:plastocyanin/azurin family copper-binding protein [Candidatus Nitrosotenuis sp.]